jgi:CelD/BcsL family acetyltransferase involved in cellulose biosynthesis
LSNLRVEKVLATEHLDALRAEWNALADTMRPRLPFVTWEWATAWWRHLREDRAAVGDSLCVRTVRNAEGELIAVAPLMVTERPRFGPLRVRKLHLFGADPNITEIRRMCCRPAWEDEACRALLEDLERERPAWDWLVLSGISDSAGAFLATPGLQRGRDVPDYVLPLPSSWNALRATLKHNIKESLRKCYNSLQRDGLSARLTVVSEPGQIEAGLQDFFRLHAARAGQAGTIPHQDVFRSRPARQFLVDVCRSFARRGATRLFLLEVGGKVVAARIGFAFGDELYLYYSGYDPEYARYSVMTTAVAEVIKWAIDNRFELINLSTGNDVSKTRWGPREIVFREAVLVRPRMRARLAHRAVASAGVASRALWVASLALRLFGRRAG